MTDDSFFFERKWDGRGDYSANPTAFAHFICLIVSLGFGESDSYIGWGMNMHMPLHVCSLTSNDQKFNP